MPRRLSLVRCRSFTLNSLIAALNLVSIHAAIRVMMNQRIHPLKHRERLS
ncbi:hypothetical protein GGX14DRAFT_574429 [Mycena pura]|uniref:Uncharacterized protein n=1 Tax=Mycena pura TaxID=153505 RepID=A0AAD6V167_9AGAR|nr:hypothetical protein GGX14DRAFT_574429 [Mycena pura]